MKKTIKLVINEGYGGFRLSKKAEEMFLKILSNEKRRFFVDQEGYFDDSKVPRHMPELVLVVEKLGEKAASGDWSDLVVVELETEKYQIAEYDGWEYILTPQTMEWVEP